MERLRFLKIKRGFLCLLLPLCRLLCNKESTYWCAVTPPPHTLPHTPGLADSVYAPDLTTGSGTADLGGSVSCLPQRCPGRDSSPCS